MIKRRKITIILILACILINIIPAKAAYHKHTDGNGTIRSDIIYSSTNPGGCYVANGHEHNKTGTCSYTMTQGYEGCSCSSCYCRDGDHSIDTYTCQNCGHGHHNGRCGAGYRAPSKNYTCGSPTNRWKPCSTTQQWGYTIKYYKNNVLAETVTNASTSQTFTAPRKTYTNYKTPAAKTVTLANDDSTVINYYYTLNQYTITTKIDGGYGSLSQTQYVDYNQNSTIYYYPANGYDINYVKINGSEVSKSETLYVFKNVKANQTVNVKFKITSTRLSEITNSTYNWIDLKLN